MEGVGERGLQGTLSLRVCSLQLRFQVVRDQRAGVSRRATGRPPLHLECVGCPVPGDLLDREATEAGQGGDGDGWSIEDDLPDLMS